MQRHGTFACFIMLPVSHTLCPSALGDGQKGKEGEEELVALVRLEKRLAAGGAEGVIFHKLLQLRLAHPGLGNTPETVLV